MSYAFCLPILYTFEALSGAVTLCNFTCVYFDMNVCCCYTTCLVNGLKFGISSPLLP